MRAALYVRVSTRADKHDDDEAKQRKRQEGEARQYVAGLLNVGRSTLYRALAARCTILPRRDDHDCGIQGVKRANA